MNKRNIFEHILYEIDIYFYSHERIKELLQIKSKNESTIQNEYNCLWDSFFIHLRNLLNFFKSTGRKDDLLCGDIFKDNINTKQLKVSFTIEYEINDCYYLLNEDELETIIHKSICHLSKTRNKQQIDINGKIIKTGLEELQKIAFSISHLFLKEKIYIFLCFLKNRDNIRQDYLNDYDEYKHLIDDFIDKIICFCLM